MPLPKRSIVPVHVARSVYQQDELASVELETVTNTTLTNIIRQLSSLSKHSEDVFGELARDVGNIGDRANSLQARIDRLSIKVTQLDSTGEEVPLTDITRKKAFKSAKIFDQQIFSRATMPAPMLETYALCDKPPPLDKLNVYRDDGKDGLKFYTDPNYFFELWRQEMLKDTERVMHDKGKKLHRPRQDGAGGPNAVAGGRGHKKRVRAPHNTREKQRQIAIGHGETLMPQDFIYRTPNSVVNEEAGYGGTQLYEIQTIGNNNFINQPQQQQHQFQQQLQVATMCNASDEDDFQKLIKNPTSMGVYDSRPARPNSIDWRQSEQIDGGGIYGPLSPNTMNAGGQYAANYGMNGMHDNSTQQQQHHGMQHGQHGQPIYDEAIYHHAQQQAQHQQQQQQQLYGQHGNPMSPETIYAPGTPSRTKPRPSQPPPAPPSNGSGGGSTPTASNGNTPTRGRSMSTSRDALPPPPPIPDGMVNTTSPSQMLAQMNGGVAAKLLARTNSNSRAGSPQLAPSNSVQDANALVMAQLNNTINSFNNLNVSGGGMSQPMNSINDLPPPPPVPDQQSPKMSSPNAAPPPPPPPPPLDENGGHINSGMQQIMPKSLTNGDVQVNGLIMGGVVPQQLKVAPKKLLPPFHDTRTDLMKSIRDGIKLRKVEKLEQKEYERNTGLHDVASILARRVFIELSDPEESDSEDDSEGWTELTETSA